ncbi:MAG TPA: hypothetical protein VNJ07_11180 [Chitinophagales bacterium]|nr:hypothetical protein [Chitinophagales bacterium]
MLFFLWTFSSCREEPVPSYINIPSISLSTTTSQGSASSLITDAWVYADANLQGVYPLPVEFPFLAEGSARLIIFAGIKLNGISATRASYPLYSPDTIDIVLEAKITDTVFPAVRYSPAAVFNFIEDFENGSRFTHMQRITSEVFEGVYSARLAADDSSEVIALPDAAYFIPFNTSAAFLEMDYKNNREFIVGIKAFFGTEGFSVFKLTVTTSNDWNKLYVNFTPEVNQLQADNYQIFFSAAPDAEPDSVHIFLDNLKLIHARVQ